MQRVCGLGQPRYHGQRAVSPASSAYASNPLEGNSDPCLWLASYTRKIRNAVRLQKALYAETCAYKDVRIHVFCHATLNAKASLWLLLHTAHPACVRLTPNTEQIYYGTNCNIPYIWIFGSYTSRGHDWARHAGKKWGGEIDHPWERGWILPYC